MFPFFFIFWNDQNSLKMIWKIICKIAKKISRIVWLCEFGCDINDWDLKTLYKDLKSWKKNLKKIYFMV